MTTGLCMRWIPVVDARGRIRPTAIWVTLAEASATRAPEATAPAATHTTHAA